MINEGDTVTLKTGGQQMTVGKKLFFGRVRVFYWDNSVTKWVATNGTVETNEHPYLTTREVDAAALVKVN